MSPKKETRFNSSDNLSFLNETISDQQTNGGSLTTFIKTYKLHKQVGP